MSSIKVAVRCRPLFDQERPATGLDIQNRRILLDSKTYDPDYTFAPAATQDDVFAVCRPILQCVKDGLNGTIMVYGQTGTGKTYTMLGNDSGETGLVHKVIAHMLEHVQQKTLEGSQCALTLSMIEIYNEKLTDMLSVDGEEEVTLIGGFPRFTNKITLARVSDANEAVKSGLAWRHTAATMMNERSSRSHVVLIIDFEEFNEYTQQTDVAHLFLVDLAGSESLKKSQASGSTASEAGKINRSLLALKSVFLALSNTSETTRPTHVPYRDSRLTELLQDSIGGTARTLMVACISAVGRDLEETKSTLMYAVKARSIRNAANTDKEKLLIRLRSMEVENQRLRNRLQERVSERGGYYVSKEEHERFQQLEENNNELRSNVEQLVKDRETTEARKHISESHTKVLQGIVADKEEELQSFKQVYHDALKRFENQAAVLQKVVHTAVEGARKAMCGNAQRDFCRLDEWRMSILQALGELTKPLLKVGTIETLEEEEQQQQQLQQAIILATECQPVAPPSLPPPPPPATSSSQQQLHRISPNRNGRGSIPPSQRSSAIRSLQPSPVRGGGGFGNGGTARTRAARRLHSQLSNQQQSSGSADSMSGIARVLDLTSDGSTIVCGSTASYGADLIGVNTTTSAASVTGLIVGPGIPMGGATAAAPSISAVQATSNFSFLAQADAECFKIAARINTAFTEMTMSFVQAQERHARAVAQLQGRRKKEIAGVYARLRQAVEDSIQDLEKAEEHGQRAMEEAQEELQAHTATRAAYPLPAEPTLLHNTVRDACLATVHGAETAFPSGGVSTEVHAALDGVLRAYINKSTAASIDGLMPLATMADPQLYMPISGSSSPKVTPELMPPLAPSAGMASAIALSMSQQQQQQIFITNESQSTLPESTVAPTSAISGVRSSSCANNGNGVSGAKENAGYMASTLSQSGAYAKDTTATRTRASLWASNRSSNVMSSPPAAATLKRIRSAHSSTGDSARSTTTTRPERSRRKSDTK